MKPNAILIESYFLPPLAWFLEIMNEEVVILDTSSKYQKQSYRNRCTIKTANGCVNLSIPIAGSQNLPFSEIKIDYKTNWQILFWRSMCSAYNKSPFFEYYKPELEQVLFTKFEYLYQLNEAFIKFTLKCLKQKKQLLPINELVNYDINNRTGRVTNKPKSLNISSEYQFSTYKQVFGSNFDNNLSIIDLISCCGPDSIEVLRKSEIIR
jgi:hypothetical protein